MMKILVKKKISLSMSWANHEGWLVGDVVAPEQRHRVAKNHVNNFNYFFLNAIWCNPVDLRHLAVNYFK